jgi:hypothetical protein
VFILGFDGHTDARGAGKETPVRAGRRFERGTDALASLVVFRRPEPAMRNLVASSTRRWRFPLAPSPSSDDGDAEQIVASCYDPESRVTYAVTDACNLYGMRDSAAQGDHAELCLEMCLVRVSSFEHENESHESRDDALEEDVYAPELPRATKIVGMAFVDDIRGICVACATGELLVVAPDVDDDAFHDLEPRDQILTTAMIPEVVGKVDRGVRGMRWNPDGELLVLATWAGPSRRPGTV